jgi:hypothetical protein
MNNFLLFIDNNSLIILAISSALAVFLLALNILLLVHVLGMRERLKIFFQGSKAQDLEDLLAQQIKRQMNSEKEIKELFKSSKDLLKMATKSIQKVAVVRFNPFKDTGGDQSFAMALLDLTDSGIVISSLFTREGTRVYSKPIEKGKSKYPLTKEEEMAIAKAKGKK